MGSSGRIHFARWVMVITLACIPAPFALGQQYHGVQIGKSCVPNLCAGNATDCTTTVTHADDFNDTLEIVEAWDMVDPLGSRVRIPLAGNLPITAVSGNTTCVVGGSLPCLLCAGGGRPCGGLPPISDQPGAVSFRSNTYVIQPDDPNPLPDQASIRVHDLCDGCGSPPCPACSNRANLVQFTAASELKVCDDGDSCTENVCDRGTCLFPPLCEVDTECDDLNPCTLDSCSADGCCEHAGGCILDSDCSDGVACTTDRCVEGCCESRPVVCTPSANPCVVRACNPATGLCDILRDGCFDGNPCTEDRCTAGGCVNQRLACCSLDCRPMTKARVDVWNEDERRFSGTERCIPSWDQRLLSDYTAGGIRNHFLRMFLQTDHGKARIDGQESAVCGSNTADAPLLGVAARELVNPNGPRAMAGSELVGMGQQNGLILYDLAGSPPMPTTRGSDRIARSSKSSSRPALTVAASAVDAPGAIAGPSPDVVVGRSSASQKGSLLAFVNVEVKWNRFGVPIQDTLIELSNDYPDTVRVQTYLVSGDECDWVDQGFTLTPDQPVYWSARTGLPAGMTPINVLGAGCPDDDPFNLGGTRAGGYLLVWAIDPQSGVEMHWNHLSGSATIVNYPAAAAWEYAPWTFQAVAAVSHGAPLLAPYGSLGLDDLEYQSPPSQLLLDFFASGTSFSSAGSIFGIDTDLTLWAAHKDLRQDAE